jgi:hypothetical protein
MNRTGKSGNAGRQAKAETSPKIHIGRYDDMKKTQGLKIE